MLNKLWNNIPESLRNVKLLVEVFFFTHFYIIGQFYLVCSSHCYYELLTKSYPVIFKTHKRIKFKTFNIWKITYILRIIEYNNFSIDSPSRCGRLHFWYRTVLIAGADAGGRGCWSHGNGNIHPLCLLHPPVADALQLPQHPALFPRAQT